jgi:hypothetical protein
VQTICPSCANVLTPDLLEQEAARCPSREGLAVADQCRRFRVKKVSASTVEFTLRAPTTISADMVEAWLTRWGWVGKVLESVNHSPGKRDGRVTHHRISIQIEPEHEARSMAANVQSSWRAHVAALTKEGPKPAAEGPVRRRRSRPPAEPAS